MLTATRILVDADPATVRGLLPGDSAKGLFGA